MPNSIKHRGTIHIVRTSSPFRAAEEVLAGQVRPDKFHVMFADYGSPGGAMGAREVIGQDGLKEMLVKMRVDPQALNEVFQSLTSNGSASILDIVLSDEELGRLELRRKDDPYFQRERIRRVAAEVYPDYKLVFDEAKPPNWIRFRLDDEKSGTIVALSGEYHASEIADWTDEYLRKYMRNISPYFSKSS